MDSLSHFFFKLNLDTSEWKNSMGTGLGFPFIIKKFRNDFQYIAGLCTHLVVIADWYKEVLKINGIPSEKVSFIPQGLTGKGFSKKSTELLAHGPIKILYLGRITPIKGLLILLKALKDIKGNFFELNIYGDVTDEVYYKQCMSFVEGNENVHWYPSCISDKVPEIMSEHDLVCVPSICAEMAPLVIQEAFAAGLPVLAADAPGNAEMVTHEKNGWLFEMGNSKSLMEILILLSQNREFITKAMRSFPVNRKFDEVAQAYDDLYRNKIVAI
jgi:glycosyltransferase involved in cell wall biosynthesis